VTPNNKEPGAHQRNRHAQKHEPNDRESDLPKSTYPKKKLEGKHKVGFIYNDYHQKFTNPGYSRNALGCFYTR